MNAVTIITYLLAAAWGGLWWRFRGGALTAINGWDPRTNGMRAVAALAITLFVGVLSPTWTTLLLAPALWTGWACAGWGAFQEMGTGMRQKRNPVASFLAWMGLQPASLGQCAAGMAIEGMICMAPVAVIAGWITASPWRGVAVVASGLVFTPCYVVAQYGPWAPSCGRIIPRGSRTAIAEVLVGAIIVPVLVWSVWTTPALAVIRETVSP